MTASSEPEAPEAPVPVALGRILLGLVLIVLGLAVLAGTVWLIAIGWTLDGWQAFAAELVFDFWAFFGGLGVVLIGVGGLLLVRARRKDTGIRFGAGSGIERN